MDSYLKMYIIPICALFIGKVTMSHAQNADVKTIPYLEFTPIIDGNLNEWKDIAFNEGAWDLSRVKATSWYSPKRNKLTIHADEDTNSVDLSANYYVAFTANHILLGAIVVDNVMDVQDSKHEDKRWYYKDAIAWFFEFPSDSVSEKFGDGDHAFAFIADTTYPSYGAWWRHGNHTQSYIEERIPASALDYAIEYTSNGYIIEAKISVNETVMRNLEMNDWKSGLNGSMMIVHCDPDGEEYGGHLLIYGKGDNDATWTKIKLGKHEK